MSNIGTGSKFSKDAIMEQIFFLHSACDITIGCDSAHRGWHEQGKFLRFLEFFSDFHSYLLQQSI